MTKYEILYGVTIDQLHEIQAGQFKAGYTEYCKDCSLKRKKHDENYNTNK